MDSLSQLARSAGSAKESEGSDTTQPMRRSTEPCWRVSGFVSFQTIPVTWIGLAPFGSITSQPGHSPLSALRAVAAIAAADERSREAAGRGD